MLSSAENNYILEGLHANCRSDGRSRLDSRIFSIQTRVSTKAHGSALVKLTGPHGHTTVLANVDASLQKQDAPHLADHLTNDVPLPVGGMKTPCIRVNVDLGPLASADATSGNANANLHSQGRRLSNFFENSLHVRPKDLAISRNTFWYLNIDIQVLASGAGNSIDAMMLALHVALRTTILPRVHITENSGEKDKAYNNQITVSSETKTTSSLSLLQHTEQDSLTLLPAAILSSLPLSITFGYFSSHNGNYFFVDPNANETNCDGVSLVTMAIDASGNLRGIYKEPVVRTQSTSQRGGKRTHNSVAAPKINISCPSTKEISMASCHTVGLVLPSDLLLAMSAFIANKDYRSLIFGQVSMALANERKVWLGGEMDINLEEKQTTESSTEWDVEKAESLSIASQCMSGNLPDIGAL